MQPLFTGSFGLFIYLISQKTLSEESNGVSQEAVNSFKEKFSKIIFGFE
jgi:hypothetical protein